MPTNPPNNQEEKPLRIIQASILVTKDEEESYRVGGPSGVTKIEKIELPGPHCMVPYIRLYKGDKIFADFCLHNIIGVYYDLGQQ